MVNVKKLTAIILAIIMLAALCSCTQVQPRQVEPTAQITGETASVRSGYAAISIVVPDEWTWESFDDDYSFGVRLIPKAQPNIHYDLAYHRNMFGVCGTGLKERDVFFSGSGLEGRAGYFDGADNWSFISFTNAAGSYALTVSSVSSDALSGDEYDAAVSEYNGKVEALLSTASLGVGGLSEREAVLIALDGEDPDNEYGRFDYVTGWWTVEIGDEDERTVYVSPEGEVSVPETGFEESEGTYKAEGQPSLALDTDGNFRFGEHSGSYAVFGSTLRLFDTNDGTTLYLEHTGASLKYLAEYSNALLPDGTVFEKALSYGKTDPDCR